MITLSSNKLSAQLCGFGLFFVVCIPSIKLIYSSSLLNIIPLLFICIGLFFREKHTISYKKDLIYLWVLFSFILLFLFFFSMKELDFIAFNFIYFAIIVFLGLIAFEKKTILICSNLAFMWSVLISLWQYLIGINYNANLGQTYLTVAMPIGCLLTWSLITVVFNVQSAYKMLLSVLMLCLSLLALSTLLSRGAIIIPIFISFLSFIAVIFVSKKSIFFKFISLSIISVGLLVGASFSETVELRQLYRIESLLQNFSDEPRIQVYFYAIDIIADSPFWGYGTGLAGKFFHGTYPHNIFLDVLINGGILLFIPFLMLIFIYFKRVVLFYRGININLDYISTVLLSFSLYLFLQWNVSWGLDTSYIPLLIMFMFIYYLRDKGLKEDKYEK